MYTKLLFGYTYTSLYMQKYLCTHFLHAYTDVLCDYTQKLCTYTLLYIYTHTTPIILGFHYLLLDLIYTQAYIYAHVDINI